METCFFVFLAFQCPAETDVFSPATRFSGRRLIHTTEAQKSCFLRAQTFYPQDTRHSEQTLTLSVSPAAAPVPALYPDVPSSRETATATKQAQDGGRGDNRLGLGGRRGQRGRGGRREPGEIDAVPGDARAAGLLLLLLLEPRKTFLPVFG